MSPTPYTAVIFTSARSAADDAGYAAMAARMEELAREQPGFVDIESARGDDGVGITVSYWTSDDSARAWKQQAEHLVAQRVGRERWYLWYRLRVATVEREYAYERPGTIVHMALPSDWAAAQRDGEYTVSTRGVTLAEEGFIHCSYDHQVDGVANAFYSDLDEVVLLRIDPSLLGADVVDEPPVPGAEQWFPHVYGPIPVGAVVSTITWRRDADGWHHRP